MNDPYVLVAEALSRNPHSKPELMTQLALDAPVIDAALTRFELSGSLLAFSKGGEQHYRWKPGVDLPASNYGEPRRGQHNGPAAQAPVDTLDEQIVGELVRQEFAELKGDVVPDGFVLSVAVRTFVEHCDAERVFHASDVAEALRLCYPHLHQIAVKVLTTRIASALNYLRKSNRALQVGKDGQSVRWKRGPGPARVVRSQHNGHKPPPPVSPTARDMHQFNLPPLPTARVGYPLMPPAPPALIARVDYAAVITDLERRRDAIEEVITGMDQLIAKLRELRTLEVL